VEPQQQGSTIPPASTTRNGLFQIPENERTRQMTTEISTNTTPARGLALQTMAEAMTYAKMVANSEFAPKDFRGKPESCLLAIDLGSSIGLSAIQSLQSIAVINGRPTIWGDAALALVQSSPVCEYVREYLEGDGDNLTAVCEAKRQGYPSPSVSRFSVADAKKAGLWGKSGPWTQYPQRMLALRARGFALRNAFADALRGLITAEEARDYPQAEAARDPAREPVVVRPKFPDEPKPSVVKLKAEPGKSAASDIEKARLAVSDAKDIAGLNRLRTLAGQRLTEGKFTKTEHDELVQLMLHRAEMLGDSDDGVAFEHEAAEHEVTA
jgi:hypothetical protein